MKISQFIAKSYAIEECVVESSIALATENVETNSRFGNAVKVWQRAEDAVISLEQVSSILKDYKPETVPGMEVITNVIVENLATSGIHIRQTLSNKTTQERFQIATEGLGDWIVTIWNKISEFVKKLWDWVKSLFTGKSSSEASVDKIENITKTVRNFKNDEAVILEAAGSSDDPIVARKNIAQAADAQKKNRSFQISAHSSGKSQKTIKPAGNSKSVAAQARAVFSDNKSIPIYSGISEFKGLLTGSYKKPSTDELISNIEKGIVGTKAIMAFCDNFVTKYARIEKIVKNAPEIIKAASPTYSDFKKQFGSTINNSVTENNGFLYGSINLLTFGMIVYHTNEKALTSFKEGRAIEFHSYFYYGDSEGSRPEHNDEIPLLRTEAQFEEILSIAKTIKKQVSDFDEILKSVSSSLANVYDFTRVCAIEKKENTLETRQELYITRMLIEALKLYGVSIAVESKKRLDYTCRVLEKYVEVSAHHADPLVAAKYL